MFLKCYIYNVSIYIKYDIFMFIFFYIIFLYGHIYEIFPIIYFVSFILYLTFI